jgi:hypothetical protein
VELVEVANTGMCVLLLVGSPSVVLCSIDQGHEAQLGLTRRKPDSRLVLGVTLRKAALTRIGCLWVWV